MPGKPPSKKGGKKPPASKPWLPDPESVVEVREVRSPVAGAFRIIRTNIVDPYEEPLPPPPKRPRGRRS